MATLTMIGIRWGRGRGGAERAEVGVGWGGWWVACSVRWVGLGCSEKVGWRGMEWSVWG